MAVLVLNVYLNSDNFFFFGVKKYEDAKVQAWFHCLFHLFLWSSWNVGQNMPYFILCSLLACDVKLVVKKISG